MKVTTIVPNYGSNRMNAHRPGELLSKCEWIGVPFMGGGSELKHFTARTVVANDLHRHVINLARCIAHPQIGPALYRALRRLSFHPESLAEAQEWCRTHVPDKEAALVDAMHYFTCCWMGRSEKALTSGELKGGLSLRWNSTGGDSVVRFRNATAALLEWRRILARVTFTCMDAFEFLDLCKDEPGHGIYADPPWPDDGAKYAHKFTEKMQEELAAKLSSFEHATVVVRYGDHPLIRRLYEGRWEWIEFDTRTAANKAKAEVLLVSRPASGKELW